MNPFLLQKQLRENASDLQEFCRDLKNWGEEMKRKEDSSLKKNDKPSDNKNDSAGKVRKIETKNVSKAKSPLKKTQGKIGATDYDAWSKFDADAECEKLNDDLKDDSELSDEIDESSRDAALVEKEKGNKFVKNSKWDEAIECYTKAIDCYSYDPIFYANRALCYLKKGNMDKAESDCTMSLKLDNTYVKAYQRRAAAREALNKLELAEFDLSKVIEFEPNNKESKQLLEKIRKKMGYVEKSDEQRPVSKFTASRSKSNTNSFNVKSLTTSKSQEMPPEHKSSVNTGTSFWPKEDENLITVKPIKKPPHLRSKKPLKRLEILEIDNTIEKVRITVPDLEHTEAVKAHVVVKQNVVEENIGEPVKAPSVFNKKLTETNNTHNISLKENEIEKQQVTKQETAEERVSESIKISSAFKKDRMDKVKNKTLQEASWPKPHHHTIKSDDLKIIEHPSEEIAVTKELKNTSNLNISKDEMNAVPKTSVQFYKIWRNLKTTEEKYSYLRLIEPQCLPKIFQESLEISVFSDILEILAKHFIENKNPAYDFLLHLTEVKRFSAFTMFMEPSEKKCLWRLLDYIKEYEQKSKEEVDNLKMKYEL